MKNKVKMSVIIAFIAVIGLLGIACDDSNTQSDYNIVGTYTYSQPLSIGGGTMIYTWIFSSDKTYEITNSVTTVKNTGTWLVSGNDITLTDTSAHLSSVSIIETFSISQSDNNVTFTLRGSASVSNILVSFSVTNTSITLTKLSANASSCTLCNGLYFSLSGNNCDGNNCFEHISFDKALDHVLSKIGITDFNPPGTLYDSWHSYSDHFRKTKSIRLDYENVTRVQFNSYINYLSQKYGYKFEPGPSSWDNITITHRIYTSDRYIIDYRLRYNLLDDFENDNPVLADLNILLFP